MSEAESLMPNEWSGGDAGGSISSYEVRHSSFRAARGRGRVQAVRARCLRCPWKSGLRSKPAEVRAEFKAHLKERHGGQSEYLDQVVEVVGHCIRCSGASWGPRVDRPLVDLDRPDEPTSDLHDGISEERLTWGAGNVAYLVHSKRPANLTSPKCPVHPDETLRPYRTRLVSLDGRPPSDYLPILDGTP